MQFKDYQNIHAMLQETVAKNPITRRLRGTRQPVNGNR